MTVKKFIPLAVAIALCFAAGPVLAQGHSFSAPGEQGILPPPPPPGQFGGYMVPTANGGIPGAQVGGSYTTPGGTSFHGYINGTPYGGGGGAAIRIPCGAMCGN